jgi:hypothetical protein
MQLKIVPQMTSNPKQWFNDVIDNIRNYSIFMNINAKLSNKYVQ